MSDKKNRPPACSLVALATAALCGSALGQTTPSAEPAPATGAAAATLDSVIVTGRKEGTVTAKDASAGALGERPLIETPFSINVMTRELLDRQQASFLGDFLKNDPSAGVGNVAVPFATLRGFAIGTDGALYDGLPGSGVLSDGRAGLQYIERVDVLKGASAFLHGLGASTSLGGVLNYIPKRPTDVPLRSAGVGYTNRSLLNAEVDLGDRFGEDRQFGYRLNLGLRDGEQAVENYDWTQKVAAIALDWRAAPGLVFNLGAEYVANDNPQLPPFYAVDAGVEVPEAPDARRSAAQSWDRFSTRGTNLYGRADWTLAPDWTLSAQALHSDFERPQVKEARFGLISGVDGSMALFGSEDASKNRTDSGQLMLRGKLATGPLKHSLSLGLSGFEDRGYGASAFLGVFPSNIFAPVDHPEPASALIEALPQTTRVRSASLLASDIVDFDEHWSVLLGARRARLTVDNYDTATGLVADSNRTDKTLPTAALMFKPIKGALVYLNYAEGLEQGGAVSPTNNLQFLPPIVTEQVELGAKLEWQELLFTAALFDMKRPLESFDTASGLNVQRGQQRHRGIELIANGRVTPALTIVTGAMFLDTSADGTGDPATDGKRVLGVPRFNANLWGEYRVAAVPGLALNGGVFHAGKQYLDGANTQTVPGWTRFDLGASYRTRLGGLGADFALNVENVANKSYWASAQSGILTIADPLTVKLGARLNF